MSVFCLAASLLQAQEKPAPDSARIDSAKPAPPRYLNRYDSISRTHSPKVAAFRSAVLPGWGQIYNRKYWKLPLVYGLIGGTGAYFVYNIKTYRELRDAVRIRTAAAANPPDSTGYNALADIYKRVDVNALRNYRNEFRKQVDYSVVFFILAWGLQVVDATVDAHLMSFDVSPDISMGLKLGHSALGNTDGLSLVLSFR